MDYTSGLANTVTATPIQPESIYVVLGIIVYGVVFGMLIWSLAAFYWRRYRIARAEEEAEGGTKLKPIKFTRALVFGLTGFFCFIIVWAILAIVSAKYPDLSGLTTQWKSVLCFSWQG